MKRLSGRSDIKWGKYLLLLLGLVAGAAFLLLTIGKSADVPGKPYRILFIPKVVDDENDFWKALIEGAEAGAKEYGVELEIRAADADLYITLNADNSKLITGINVPKIRGRKCVFYGRKNA